MSEQMPIDFVGTEEASLCGEGGGPIDPPQPPAITGSDDPFARYATNAYLQYGMAVLKGRSLPDVTDGQKPVQRRILYAMYELGLSSTAKHVKCARVVGEVLGKLHPHGDTSVYDAMVRQAQDFSLRYPLVDGQGNFGSRDGDGAAAMRYTECRLTRYSELLLSEISEGTVDFKPNYDGTYEEPAVLPARLPMLLLNGASGVAVGMATEIPSHNLGEISSLAVHVLRNPNGDASAFYEKFEGPDFPGGGVCITPRDKIISVYKEGRGSIALRAKYEFEDMARGQWRLVIKELPHGVSAAKVLEAIDELTNPQIKAGKKVLDPEQQRVKSLFLNLLDTVRDESGREAAVRLVFEPKTSKVDRDEFVRTLLAYTPLETPYSLNLTSIGLDGRPVQKSLMQMMTEWAVFRLSIVKRRLETRIAAIEKRLHILSGRKIAFLHIEEVIEVIRNSDEPKKALIERFALSEIQAEDILEIRLRQLARLEGFQLDQEIENLTKEKDGLVLILSSDNNLREFVIGEVEADSKKYGDDRRTTFEQGERTSVAEAAVLNEKTTILLSLKGWIKQRSGHGVDVASVTFKDGDGFMQALEVETANPIYMVTTDGRGYVLNPTTIPAGKTDGVPVNSIVELSPGAKPLWLMTGLPEDRFFICTDWGYGFIGKLADLFTRNRTGKAYFSLKPDEKVHRPLVLGAYFTCINSETGKGLAFDASELREASGGRGLQLVKLDGSEKMIQPRFVEDWTSVPVEVESKGAVSLEPVCFELSTRGKKGRLLALPNKKMKIRS